MLKVSQKSSRALEAVAPPPSRNLKQVRSGVAAAASSARVKVSPVSRPNAGNDAGCGAGAARPTAPTATREALPSEPSGAGRVVRVWFPIRFTTGWAQLLPKNRTGRVPGTGGQNSRFRPVQACCGIRERGAAALVNDCREGRRTLRQHGDPRSCLIGVRPINRVETWSRRGSARLPRQGWNASRSVATPLEGGQPFAASRSLPAMVPAEIVLSQHIQRDAALFLYGGMGAP
jgi:hypothetical protein